jgi:hypothetical protein
MRQVDSYLMRLVSNKRDCMRAIVALASLLFCSAAQAQVTVPPIWATVTQTHVNVAIPRGYIGEVFATNVGPLATTSPPPNTFTRTNLASIGVGPNAKAGLFNGILVITSGSAVEISDLAVVFRVPGDTSVTCDVPNFVGQTLFEVPAIGMIGGQRTNMSSIVPIVNQTVEWCWFISPGGAYGLHAAYAVNLSLQAWFE